LVTGRLEIQKIVLDQTKHQKMIYIKFGICKITPY